MSDKKLTRAQIAMLKEAYECSPFKITGRRWTAFDALRKRGYIIQIGRHRFEGVDANPRMVFTGEITVAGRMQLAIEDRR